MDKKRMLASVGALAVVIAAVVVFVERPLQSDDPDPSAEYQIDNAEYPRPFAVIAKEAANYDSPQNAAIATLSSLHSCDKEWHLDSLTPEYAKYKIEQYDEGLVSYEENCAGARRQQSGVLLREESYQDAIVVVYQFDYGKEHVFTGPLPFVKREGVWKLTHEFRSDGRFMGKYITTRKKGEEEQETEATNPSSAGEDTTDAP